MKVFFYLPIFCGLIHFASSQLGINFFRTLVGLFGDIQSTYLNIFAQMNIPIDWNLKTKPDASYDFVVIGAGSAGSVIASRLSEVPDWKILLLEAGDPETLIMDLPVLAPGLQGSKYDWNYLMEPEANMCGGLDQSRMGYPRGRALGGTSTINYMIYTRGNRNDYDLWAQRGNPGWSYDDVLPYFLKSERAKLRDANYAVHNRSGLWSVEDTHQTPLVNVFVEAAEELGLKHGDYNVGDNLNVADSIQGSVRDGARHSVAKAFLWPARFRRNLHMITRATVTRLLIDPETLQTNGVKFERNGREYNVKAAKEVIVSAGTFNSPKLLMLSGIGPEDELTAFNLKVLKNLPVGKVMYDHLTYPGLAFNINRDISMNIFKTLSPASVLQYITSHTGPITSLGGVEGIGYIKTAIANYTESYPDVELLFIGGSLTSDLGLLSRRAWRISDTSFYGMFKKILLSPNWSIFPLVLHPKSRGYVKLRSADPRDPPILHGNYFTDPENRDMKTFIAAIRFIQRLAATDAFRKLGSTLNPASTPGCEAFPFDSDEYWDCSVRRIAITLHHQVATVKMGPVGDAEAVVDNELRVYGIKGLRVADCSVIPAPLSAHTNAPAVMIGEKASDLIKTQWI